jgi:hypothetical protein
MRTHLVTVVATLTLAGLATAATAAVSSGGSSSGGAVAGASGGGGSSSGSSSSSSSGSSGSSGGGSSHGGGGGGSGGSAHGGGSGGGSGAHGGWNGGRGSEFTGRSGFGGSGNFGSRGPDLAHGGYQVLSTRPANVVASTTLPNHEAQSSLVLGPGLGSAAKAAQMSDDKHRGMPGSHPEHPGHPRHPHELRQVGLYQYATCQPRGCAPEEMCPAWLIKNGDQYELNSPLDCPQPNKLPSFPQR